jgi:histidine ammonia-lyase
VPTEGNQEDIVPMGMTAAWKAQRILANATRVVAIELLAGAQGLEFLKPLRPGKGVGRLHAAVRGLVPPLDADRPMAEEIERVAGAVRAAAFDHIVEGAA